MVIIIR